MLFDFFTFQAQYITPVHKNYFIWVSPELFIFFSLPATISINIITRGIAKKWILEFQYTNPPKPLINTLKSFFIFSFSPKSTSSFPSKPKKNTEQKLPTSEPLKGRSPLIYLLETLQSISKVSIISIKNHMYFFICEKCHNFEKRRFCGYDA